MYHNENTLTGPERETLVGLGPLEARGAWMEPRRVVSAIWKDTLQVSSCVLTGKLSTHLNILFRSSSNDYIILFAIANRGSRKNPLTGKGTALFAKKIRMRLPCVWEVSLQQEQEQLQ